MYYNVVVGSEYGDRSYTVTNTENRFNGYVEPGYRTFTRERDGEFKPTYRNEYKIRKSSPKPSIYKRDWYRCKTDEYKYAFTERTSRVVETSKDVYYNAHKDRFISRDTTTSYKNKVEYGLPYLIVF